MELTEFIQKNVLEEDQEKRFSICISDTLFNAIPKGVNRQVFFRRLIQLFFIMRNSVYFQKILNHLGFDLDLQFDKTLFETNFNDKFFGNHVTEKKETNTKSDQEISRLKEDKTLLIEGFKIFWQVFTEISEKLNQEPMNLDAFYNLSHFPSEDDIKKLDKINEMIKHV